MTWRDSSSPLAVLAACCYLRVRCAQHAEQEVESLHLAAGRYLSLPSTDAAGIVELVLSSISALNFFMRGT